MKGFNAASFEIEGAEEKGDRIYCICKLAGINQEFKGSLTVSEKLPNNKVLVRIVTNNTDTYYIKRDE